MMKREKSRVVTLAMLFFVGLGLDVPAVADEAVARGRTAAVLVEKGPALDGTMADPVWSKGALLPMGSCTSDEPVAHKTWARLLFDGTHVYIGVHGDEPDTDGMVMKATARDGDVWQDDSFEFFLRADPEMPYRHFSVNSRGTLADYRDSDLSWDSTAEARCSVDKGKSWTVTFRVPLKELDAYVGEGQTWTMNLYRSRQPRGGAPLLEYSWAIMSSTKFDSPDEFGLVTGVAVPRREDGVTRVREKPAPPPATAETGEEAGGVTIYRKQSFSDSVEGWAGDSAATVALVEGGIDGRALQVLCKGDFTGAQLPLNVAGSAGLRLAFHMKTRGIPVVMINVPDRISKDNTTSHAYRHLSEGEWVPVLYYLDQFRYNSQGHEGVVNGRTAYGGIRFFGPDRIAADAGFMIDNVVLYRGVDAMPPGAVGSLKALPVADGVQLTWTAAPDNVMPMVYAIARADAGGAFVKVGETCGTAFLDRGAPAGKCRYRVLAVDFEENIGPWCEPVTVKAAAASAAVVAAAVEETDRPGYSAHVRAVHSSGLGKVRKGRVVLFGDSLTYATSYRPAVQAAFLNLGVKAFGYPSMRTGFGKDNIARILKEENPEYLCLLFGTNNGKSPADIAAAMEDLAAIVKMCDENGTVALLGTIPPRGFADPASTPEADYNRAVMELGRKIQVPVAHIFESIQAAGDRKQFIADDGVHWNGAGMAIAGRAWGRALKQTRFVIRDRE